MTLEELIKIDVDERIARENETDEIERLEEKIADIEQQIKEIKRGKGRYCMSEAWNKFSELSEAEYRKRLDTDGDLS